MQRMLRVALSVLPLVAVPLPAQVLADFDDESKAITSNCSGGVVYDSGWFDYFYGIGGGTGTMVQRLALPAGATKIEQICVCLARVDDDPGIPTSVNPVDVVVYADAGSAPGTFLGGASSSVSGLPVMGSGKWVNVNVSAANIPVSGSAYVGVKYAAGGVHVCGSEFSPTVAKLTYRRSGSGPWTSMGTLFPSHAPRSLGIRADTGTGGGTGPTTCTPNATTLCLGSGDRFKVQAKFQQPGEAEGTAQVVNLTDDTGYLWFFSSSNVEAVVKVLNACGLNNRFWVFAGGLTNVRVVLTVTDTKNGTVKTYTNPQGAKYQPIQDTEAFATCP